MRRALLALLALLPLAAAAQESTRPPSQPRLALLRAVVTGGIDRYILGANDRLAAATRQFETSIGGYCRAPTKARSSAIAAGFASLLTAWAGVDFLQFGPLSRDARFDRFAFWPDPHGTAERQLRRLLASPDPSLLEAGALAAQSAAIQGLPALERILFDGDEALARTARPARYRCDLARAIAANLAAIATANRAEWRRDRGWRAVMLAPGPDNPVYVRPEEPAVELLKALLGGIERLADQRIQPARGPAPEFAKASRAPYALSGATISYWRASAEALGRFAEALGLRALLPDRETPLADSAGFEFSNLNAALARIGGSLERALKDPEPRQRLGYAIIVLRGLRDLFGSQIRASSGLIPGFNALDGD